MRTWEKSWCARAPIDAADPTLRKRLADIGERMPPREQQTSEGLAAYHKTKTEIENWWPIAAGIKADWARLAYSSSLVRIPHAYSVR